MQTICNELDIFSYYSDDGKCYATDDFCNYQKENSQYNTRSSKTLLGTRKCDKVKDENDKNFFKNVIKECEDYTESSKCSDIPKIKDRLYHKFGDWRNCQSATIEEFCYINEEGNCVKQPSN